LGQSHRCGIGISVKSYKKSTHRQLSLVYKSSILFNEHVIKAVTHKDESEVPYRKMGVDKAIMKLMSDTLATGSAEIAVGSSTIEVGTTRDTPQRGVCSPLLWSLVVDELLNKRTSTGVHCIGYAS